MVATFSLGGWGGHQADDLNCRLGDKLLSYPGDTGTSSDETEDEARERSYGHRQEVGP